MVQFCKDMVTSMKSNTFWRALGAGASAPAMLYAPRQHYMEYAASLAYSHPATEAGESIHVCAQSAESMRIAHHEPKS